MQSVICAFLLYRKYLIQYAIQQRTKIVINRRKVECTIRFTLPSANAKSHLDIICMQMLSAYT